MQLQVKGKNMPVTDALFEHAERKLQRLTRVLPPWDEAALVELELSVERNPKIDRSQVAEITVRTKGPVLRVREGAQDMYLAIDQAARKLERQAVRYRERRRRHRSPHEGEPPPPAVLDDALPGGSAPDDGTTPSADAAPGWSRPRPFRSSPCPPTRRRSTWTCCTTTSTCSAAATPARSTWSTAGATATSGSSSRTDRDRASRARGGAAWPRAARPVAARAPRRGGRHSTPRPGRRWGGCYDRRLNPVPRVTSSATAEAPCPRI